GIGGVPRALPAADYVYWIIQFASLSDSTLQRAALTSDYRLQRQKCGPKFRDGTLPRILIKRRSCLALRRARGVSHIVAHIQSEASSIASACHSKGKTVGTVNLQGRLVCKNEEQAAIIRY